MGLYQQEVNLFKWFDLGSTVPALITRIPEENLNKSIKCIFWIIQEYC